MIQTLNSIHDLDPNIWNEWVGRYPFLRHEFLAALEDSQATCADTGWIPKHLVVLDSDQPVAALPVFEKHHSRGEYVFDWSWADAFERAGGHYYPKLLSAAPFTPATGPRFLGDSRYLPEIENKLTQLLEHYSSWHGLFPTDSDSMTQLEGDFRFGIQYHWQNQGYQNFDEFLSGMTSKRRKAIKRERRIVREQGIQLQRVLGCDCTAEQRAYFYHFYQQTYAVRGQRGYLNADTFERLFARMGEQMLLITATLEQEIVGCALLFFDDTHLYGRYWGGLGIDCLHFETCYYQGIEFAIERGLQVFDPGAQGEHKIPRGFEPVKTRSLHRISHPEFAQSVRRFLAQEAQAIAQWQIQAAESLPFKLNTELKAP